MDFGTAIVRMFVSVPAHGTFGILMGYYVGLAKFARPNQRLFLWRGLATAVFFHGAFDFFFIPAAKHQSHGHREPGFAGRRRNRLFPDSCKAQQKSYQVAPGTFASRF